MPKNQITKDELKNRVIQLKNDVYEEPINKVDCNPPDLTMLPNVNKNPPNNIVLRNPNRPNIAGSNALAIALAARNTVTKLSASTSPKAFMVSSAIGATL